MAYMDVLEKKEKGSVILKGHLMEEELKHISATHLLQHTLRSLCIHENSQWVYAVFWRKLPRNHPPPQWDLPGAAYERTRGNRKNWLLAWEDGFCNFAAFTSERRGLQPELFFRMSHEIYNYGSDSLIGKVAADHSHKWVFNEPHDHDITFLSTWSNSADSQPRTWQAQFQSGIKTIALIAVREGVLQLGAVSKVIEDPSYVVLLRNKFDFIDSIPGVLLPHPSTYLPPTNMDGHRRAVDLVPSLGITPSMSSLEALLSKLPSIRPPAQASSSGYRAMPELIPSPNPPLGDMEMERLIKEDMEEEYGHGKSTGLARDCSSNSMS